MSMNEPGKRTRHVGNVFKGGGGVKQGVTFRNLREQAGPDLAGVRILTGHFPLGMREHLPGDRDVRCFTFLREPTDRTLSHYFQIRTNAERDRAAGRERSKQESFGLKPLPVDPTLDDMVEGGYIQDNLHTRMLSGDPEPFGEVTDEMLERAKHNLREKLVFFGITERFDESLVLAKQRLGLASVLYKPPGSSASAGRVNTARPRGKDVPEELTRAAERCNRYDIELYGYAQELFDGAPELGELEFEVELAALRAARSEGDVDLEGPAPARFGGSEAEWRMLLHARAILLRHERELAEIKALTYELGQGDRKILEELQGVKTRGKRVAGRDADAAATRVIQMLGAIAAALPAEDRSSAPAQTKASGDGSGAKADGAKEEAPSPEPSAPAAGGRRGRRQRKPRTGSASRRRRRATGTKRGSGRQQSASGKRRRSTSRASAEDAPEGRAARKGRKRSAGESQHG
jgi:hypothetical protein